MPEDARRIIQKSNNLISKLSILHITATPTFRWQRSSRPIWGATYKYGDAVIQFSASDEGGDELINVGLMRASDYGF